MMNKKDYTIRLINPQDYNIWIELAGEVESLFGPMINSKEFQEGIKYCIQNNNAFGIENCDKDLAGIIALDRENNEITWLAVVYSLGTAKDLRLFVRQSASDQHPVRSRFADRLCKKTPNHRCGYHHGVCSGIKHLV